MIEMENMHWMRYQQQNRGCVHTEKERLIEPTTPVWRQLTHCIIAINYDFFYEIFFSPFYTVESTDCYGSKWNCDCDEYQLDCIKEMPKNAMHLKVSTLMDEPLELFYFFGSFFWWNPTQISFPSKLKWKESGDLWLCSPYTTQE